MTYMNARSWSIRGMICSAIFSLLVAMPVGKASAQGLPLCSWPFEVTGHGITNVATPDTNATYWVMPFDTGRWKALVIKGRYPEARFVNFSTYLATGVPVASIVDAEIAPDSGVNPFTTTTDDELQSYTITVGPETTPSANHLRVGMSRVAFLVYRVYVPDQGLDRKGGVDLPGVTLIAPNGDMRSLQPCPFADAESSLGNLIILLRINGFTDAANFLQGILMAASQLRFDTGTCNPSQPASAAVTFAPATLGTDFFPNLQTTYLETAGLCFQAGKVLVIRGKAPVFPDTYRGGSVFDPAFGTQIQMRYWSMCNNNREIPYSVVGCQADFATLRDASESYTYMVSDDLAPPPWLPPLNATWLPWGNTEVPKNLIFRNILLNNPAVAGDYTPKGVYCDKTLFMQQGWPACFAAAGVSPP